MAGAAGAVRGEGSRVGGCGPLGECELLGLPRAARADCLEEGAVGALRRVRKAAPEAAEQDRRPALDDRKVVAPESQRQAEPEIGGKRWVRRLARQVRRR